MYILVIILMAVLVGAGAGYLALKGVKDTKHKEFRYEGQITLLEEGIDPIDFKNAILTDETLEHTIQEHDLVKHWNKQSMEDAKAHIRHKFDAKVNGFQVTISYLDSDRALSEKILRSLLENFRLSHSPAPQEGG